MSQSISDNAGYKIATFTVVQPQKQKPAPFCFNNNTLHPKGAMGCVEDTLIDLQQSKGANQESLRRYLQIEDVRRSNRSLVVTVLGGAYGHEYDVIDTGVEGGKHKSRVEVADALTWRAYVVFVFPPNGFEGVMVALTRGNRSHLSPLVTIINDQLRRIHDLKMDVRYDIADGVGWEHILNNQKASIESVTFRDTQPSGDHTSLAASADIARVSVTYDIRKGSVTHGWVTEKILRNKGKVGRDELLTLVGGSAVEADPFNEGSVSVVIGQRQRTLNIGSTRSWFVYALEVDGEVTERAFLQATEEAAMDTLNAIRATLPASWWPELD